jgi:predicted component of type VI protein secretion system
MGVIKTALEIALEKTENIKSDKSSIDQFDAKQQGKKLANAFLAGETDLTAAIKKTPASQLDSLKQGVFDVLITQIALPAGKEDEQRLEKAGKGLETIINNKQFKNWFKQLVGHLS